MSLNVLAKLTEELDLNKYVVVGKYLRYDRDERNKLFTRAEHIKEDLVGNAHGGEIYIIWGGSSVGKTFFLDQIAQGLASQVLYKEIRVDTTADKKIATEIETALSQTTPVLFVLDEADAGGQIGRSYESYFGLIERAVNSRTGPRVLFFLLGSKGASIGGFERLIASGAHSKGTDLLNRATKRHSDLYRISMSSPTLFDVVLTAASVAAERAKTSGHTSVKIERPALFYLLDWHLQNPEINGIRAVGPMTKQAMDRSKDIGSLKLEYFFDQRVQERRYWRANGQYLDGLEEDFVNFRGLG